MDRESLFIHPPPSVSSTRHKITDHSACWNFPQQAEFDKSKPSTVQSGVLPLTESGTYLVSDGVPWILIPSSAQKKMPSWTLPAHQLFFSAGERVSLRDKRELPLLSPFRVRGPMGSHGHPGVISHTARSGQLIYSGRVWDQQTSLSHSHTIATRPGHKVQPAGERPSQRRTD